VGGGAGTGGLFGFSLKGGTEEDTEDGFTKQWGADFFSNALFGAAPDASDDGENEGEDKEEEAGGDAEEKVDWGFSTKSSWRRVCV
jgi:hypothetical protein